MTRPELSSSTTFRLTQPEVHVVSMRNHEGRRQAISGELAGRGVAFSFFDAIDGALLGDSPKYDRARRMRLAGKDLQPGELGCYASHLELMRMIVQSEAPYAVILEDDVTVTDEFLPVIAGLAANASHLEIVKLGSASARARAYRPIAPLTQKTSLVRYKRAANGTQGYFVTRAAAEKFLSYSTRFCYPVDVAMNRVWENHLNVLGVQPWVVVHDRSWPSSIDAKRFDGVQNAPQYALERRMRKIADSFAKRAHYLRTFTRDRRLAAALDRGISSTDDRLWAH
ncbi:MAG: hypothetical protein GC190_03295 [Alphaproteobacteria bacterium]|nr:hypothetical protein [Alphaproteobacteria bacterium]